MSRNIAALAREASQKKRVGGIRMTQGPLTQQSTLDKVVELYPEEVYTVGKAGKDWFWKVYIRKELPEGRLPFLSGYCAILFEPEDIAESGATATSIVTGLTTERPIIEDTIRKLTNEILHPSPRYKGWFRQDKTGSTGRTLGTWLGFGTGFYTAVAIGHAAAVLIPLATSGIGSWLGKSLGERLGTATDKRRNRHLHEHGTLFLYGQEAINDILSEYELLTKLKEAGIQYQNLF